MLGPTIRRNVLLAGFAAVFLVGPSEPALSEPPPPTVQADKPPQDTDLPYYVFRALRQGTEIEFSGVIRYGTAQDLRQILGANSAAKMLHLNSPGGEVFEAREMVQIVRARGLTTTTDKFCMSACTLVFLAGRERYLAPGAQLGFHRPDAFDMSPAEIDAIERSDRDFMLSLGIPSAFVDKAFSTPSSAIWIPKDSELKSAGVITGVNSKFLVSVDRYTTRTAQDEEFFGKSLNLYGRPILSATSGSISAFSNP
jgi:hypothetical protein